SSPEDQTTLQHRLLSRRATRTRKRHKELRAAKEEEWVFDSKAARLTMGIHAAIKEIEPNIKEILEALLNVIGTLLRGQSPEGIRCTASGLRRSIRIIANAVQSEASEKLCDETDRRGANHDGK